MAKKCILLLLDGLGDRSHKILDDRTPLQAARTPVLDRLSRRGANGLFHAALLGQALPSENAHFALFGYDMDGFPGRGALEALGAGIPLGPGDVALLAHFITAAHSPDGILMQLNGTPRLKAEERVALTEAVGHFSVADVAVRFHPTHGIRGILTLSGQVAPFVTDSDPMQDNRPLVAVQPLQQHAHDPIARKTADAVGAFLQWCYHTLRRHPVNDARRKAGLPPVNGMATQRAGRLKTVETFRRVCGLKGISIASSAVYHGLAAYIGMDCRKVADTPDPSKDLAQRLQMAMAALPAYDFIHVHTKMPDEAAHTKDPLYKTRVIEALDQGIGTVLETLLTEPDLLLVIAADHSTPSSGPLIHSGEPVPVIFHGPGIRRDRVEAYDEVRAAGGALGLMRGKELLYMILNHLDRAKLHGIMDTPVDRPYWPGPYEPFRLRDAPRQTTTDPGPDVGTRP